mmetsp:Transcript_6047/g.11464  ORF Transcript_6047/g.11464 Transcript_6047/m.11464 type:complete len:439 (+) Transcript_6047:174-1490(+)|eukprot:CAMPEP_0176488656 /NCGR_PEP_ID=MMETSP0200_2-20121128/6835_1 /TAXON_ID=947934 /ORGANISM="Chaetoceros sp., Strain GSL56" /LENGTH=438 /DNA_ID=CAMNT_0017885673 /DNA_START=59 /DNA_END=1375 /DNA_ORIENTATION=+
MSKEQGSSNNPTAGPSQGPSDNHNNNSNQSYRGHPNENELYRPTLLYLKCRGALHLSSPEHKAVCKGLPNRLEIIREYPPMKPRQAFHTFQHQISMYNPDDDRQEANDSFYQAGFGGYGDDHEFDGDNKNRKGRSSSSSLLAQHQRRKRSSINTKQASQQQQRLPHVVDEKWDEMRKTLQEQTSVDLSKLDKTESEMTMYGTSSVYFLVLKPYSEINAAIIKSVNQNQEGQPQPQQQQNQQKQLDESSRDKTANNMSVNSSLNKSFIYAINPVNELGISKRKISSLDDGIVCSSTTVKLGILEIHMASLGEENQDEKDTSSAATNAKTTKTPTTTTQSSLENDTQVYKSSLPSTMGMGVPSLQDMQRFIDKVDKFGDRLLDQMYQNAKFIKNEVENDFLNRTWKASEKIVGSFEKNLIRMKKNLVDTIKFFTDSSGKD